MADGDNAHATMPGQQLPGMLGNGFRVACGLHSPEE